MESARETKLKDIQPNNSPYFNKSKEWARHLLYTEIKGVFVGALSAVETRLGKGFPAYQELRSEILGIGNSAIRKMHQILDKLNISYIPETSTFDMVKNKDDNLNKVKDEGKDEKIN